MRSAGGAAWGCCHEARNEADVSSKHSATTHAAQRLWAIMPCIVLSFRCLSTALLLSSFPPRPGASLLHFDLQMRESEKGKRKKGRPPSEQLFSREGTVAFQSAESHLCRSAPLACPCQYSTLPPLQEDEGAAQDCGWTGLPVGERWCVVREALH